MSYRLKKTEQETQIWWDAEEKTAHIFSANPTVIRKLDKLSQNFPEAYKCIWVDGKFAGKKYEFDSRSYDSESPRARDKRRLHSRMVKRISFIVDMTAEMPDISGDEW